MKTYIETLSTQIAELEIEELNLIAKIAKLRSELRRTLFDESGIVIGDTVEWTERKYSRNAINPEPKKLKGAYVESQVRGIVQGRNDYYKIPHFVVARVLKAGGLGAHIPRPLTELTKVSE